MCTILWWIHRNLDNVWITGNVGSTQYTFSGLPSGKYFVGGYDNNGTKIFDGNFYKATENILIKENSKSKLYEYYDSFSLIPLMIHENYVQILHSRKIGNTF